MHHNIPNMHYVPCNLSHKLFNLALHCLYLCHQNFMLAPHCLNSDFTMYITKLFNPKSVYSIPLR
jgi:hypothetical protein